MLLEEVLSKISIPIPSNPSTYSFWSFKPVYTEAFIASQWQSVVMWQTKAEPGTARYSRLQPGTARYSAEKTQHVLYFRKEGDSRILNMMGWYGWWYGGDMGGDMGVISGVILEWSRGDFGDDMGGPPTPTKYSQILNSVIFHFDIQIWWWMCTFRCTTVHVLHLKWLAMINL